MIDLTMFSNACIFFYIKFLVTKLKKKKMKSVLSLIFLISDGDVNGFYRKFPITTDAL